MALTSRFMNDRKMRVATGGKLPKADLEAATMRSVKGGCLAARLTVELMTCKLATNCELSVGKITRV